MCPKMLSELKHAQRNVSRVGGKKIDFAPIVQTIVASKEMWTVSEVHKQLVKEKVSRVRTLKLLNANSGKGHKLDALWDEGKLWFGAFEIVNTKGA